MSTYPYLGMPGSMVQLPGPNGDLDAPLSRGDNLVTTLSGASAVVRRVSPKRTYTLPYTSRPGTGLEDVLGGFYMGLFGEGPFVFVDPSIRNVLGTSSSTCGIRSQMPPGWIPSSGTVVTDLSVAAPVPMTGVLRLSGESGSASLIPGATATTVSPTSAPVYLATELCTASLYVQASAAGTYTLSVLGLDVNGSTVTIAAATAVALAANTWTRIVAPAAANALTTCQFAVPKLTIPSSAPSSVWIAAAQLEYGTVTAWQPGRGSPRVIIPATPGRTVPLYGYAEHTLTLVEV